MDGHNALFVASAAAPLPGHRHVAASPASFMQTGKHMHRALFCQRALCCELVLPTSSESASSMVPESSAPPLRFELATSASLRSVQPTSSVSWSSVRSQSLHSSKQQGDVALQTYVAIVCSKCFRCFKSILQVYV